MTALVAGQRWLDDLPRTAVFGVVALLALAARARQSVHDVAMFNDGPRFLEVARALQNGDVGTALTDAFHPLTAALIALLATATESELELAGRAISIVSGVIAACVATALARDQFGTAIGLVTGLLFAVHPRLVAASSSVQSDGLHLMWALLGAYGVWRALETKRLRPALLGGVACGLAYLTRPEGLIVAVVAAVWLAADTWSGRIRWTRATAVGLAFAIGLAALATPYALALRRETGEWRLTQKKSVQQMVTAPAVLAVGEGASAGAGSGGVSSRIARGGAALFEVAHDGSRSLHKVFYALCLFGFRRGRPSRPTLYALSYVGILFCVLLGLHLAAGYVSRRHWLVAAALCLPFAARGLLTLAVWLGARVPRLRGRDWWVPASIGATVIVCFFYFVERTESPVKNARKQAAVWLADRAPQHIVAGHRSRLGFYAQAAGFVPVVVAGTPQQIVDDVRAKGAEFLVLDGQRLAGAHDAQEVHRVPYSGGAVLVLELKPTSDSP